MPQLVPGQTAPSFEALDHDGKQVRSMDLLDKRVVLYFFPKADTSGWTIEARQFDERLADLEKEGVRVVGMSPDPADALKAFRDKYDLEITFLSDPDHSTLEAYGAWGERAGRGPGVIRSTVLIGKDGRIERAWYAVKADGHPEEVLQAIRGVGPPA